ncbi:MAG: hypothetical protein JWR52_3381 [Marmoricola sp.]|nr:hypothetical protein [Marmoricola sp.]
MSGILFAVIAVGWAAYLLPMALKRHDDVAKSRPVEEFSSSMRVLGRRPAAAAAPAVSSPVVEPVETVAAQTTTPTITREAARRAARRRRRVLAVLLLAAVAVSATSYLGYTPWLTTAIPGALVVAFLVVARLTVRAQQVRRVAPVQHSVAPAPLTAEEIEPDLGGEDTVGLSRDELADAVAAPVLDEGSLWDPLPVTLPTYVNKARARRTVRTIEITTTTTGITSSGHDAADSALAREAEALQAEVEAEADIVEAPKAAGA